MTGKTLKPCPNCGRIDYEYGSYMLSYLGETVRFAAELYLSREVAVGRVFSSSGSGLGVFSLPKLFYQGVFLNLDGHPLLRCRHCNYAVTCCIKCSDFMLLERLPKTAELIECPHCKARFQTCESDDVFDTLLRVKK